MFTIVFFLYLKIQFIFELLFLLLLSAFSPLSGTEDHDAKRMLPTKKISIKKLKDIYSKR
jgi:hypothetical protein